MRQLNILGETIVRWIVQNAKIFCSYDKHFWIFPPEIVES